MADDKKIIFSMVGVNKIFPPQKQVLKNIYLSFFYGAKIGIIGLNGSGKSTLLKIIAGIDKDYQGEVVFSPGYSVGYLEQDPKLEPGKTVKEIVQEGVQEIVDTLKEYEEVNERFGDPEVLEDPDKMDALINRQAELQDRRYGRMEPRQPSGTCHGRFALSAGGSGGGYVVRRRASPGGPLPIAAPAAGRIAVG